MDVLFIQHKTTEKAVPRFLSDPKGITTPLPFVYLAGYLGERGYSSEILDMRIEKSIRVIAAALERKPLLVGFTCMMGPQIRSLIKLSRLVKRLDPTLPIVYGGVHASFFPALCLKEPYVDYVVMGEGEETLAELIETIRGQRSPKTVKGLAYKQNGEIHVNQPRDYIDLDKSPRGAWHLVEKYMFSYLRGGLRINTARGCPRRCRFCYNTVFNRKYREKSATKVIDEIEFLANNYGVRALRFMDDNWLANPRRAREMAQGFLSKKLGVTFHADLRIDAMTEEWLATLAKAGLTSVFTGVEAGTDELLSRINKEVTVAEVLAAGACGEGARHSLHLLPDVRLPRRDVGRYPRGS